MIDKDCNNSMKSQGFDALCVKLYDEGRLYQMEKGSGTKDFSYLSDIIMDILSIDLDDSDQAMASGILLDLIKKAEKDLKLSLVARLANKESIPFEVILHLANEEIDIARPILKNSPCFSDMDLMYFIHSHDSEYWQAIAQRKNLSDQAITMLAKKRDIPTSKTLLKNEDISIPSSAMEVFCELTNEESILADLIAVRPEATKDIVNLIVDKVSAHIKTELSEKFDLSVSAEKIIEKELREVRKDCVDMVLGDIKVTADMQNLAYRLKDSGVLNRNKILKALNQGHVGTFVAFMAAYLDISVESVHESLKQPCGKAIAVVAKAADFSKNEFLMMYAMTKCMRMTQTHDGQSVALSSALKYFDRVSCESAKRMIRIQAD